MRTQPTSNPPADLNEAVNVYRTFWERVRSINASDPLKKVRFDGSAQDLEALDYCEYELGYPDADLRLASLIWAQVMVVSSEAQWLEPICGMTAICGPNHGYPQLIFFPHARLLEIERGSYTQFATFGILTDSFLFQAVHAGYSVKDLPNLCDLSSSYDHSQSVSNFDRFERDARLLRLLETRRKRNDV